MILTLRPKIKFLYLQTGLELELKLFCILVSQLVDHQNDLGTYQDTMCKEALL